MARIVRDEIFGFIATTHLFDEAINIINDSSYALAYATWTASSDNTGEFTKKVGAGTV